MNNSKRIKTLEALRGIAFIAVMFHHTGQPRLFVVSAGTWAVSVFFIISGFVEVLSRYYKDPIEPTLKNSIKYGINKIKKIYPLHILTALAILVFDFFGTIKESIKVVLFKFVTNVLFIQEWIPTKMRSINGTSWYLCTLLFFYFLSPLIIKRIKTNYSVKKAFRNIVIIYLIQLIVGLIGHLIPVNNLNPIFEYDLSYWLIYRFPLTRLLDILLGCNLAYLFISNENRIIKNVNKKEIILLITTVILFVVYYNSTSLIGKKLEVPVTYKDVWYSLVVLFSPVSLLAVWLFVYGQGKITKALTNKLTLFFARISSSGFLIHSVIYNYLYSFICVVLGKATGDGIMSRYGSYICISIGIILTIICCLIWERIINYFRSRKNKEN